MRRALSLTNGVPKVEPSKVKKYGHVTREVHDSHKKLTGEHLLVWLDGQLIEKAAEADDIEGWVEFWIWSQEHWQRQVKALFDDGRAHYISERKVRATGDVVIRPRENTSLLGGEMSFESHGQHTNVPAAVPYVTVTPAPSYYDLSHTHSHMHDIGGLGPSHSDSHHIDVASGYYPYLAEQMQQASDILGHHVTFVPGVVLDPPARQPGMNSWCMNCRTQRWSYRMRFVNGQTLTFCPSCQGEMVDFA